MSSPRPRARFALILIAILCLLVVGLALRGEFGLRGSPPMESPVADNPLELFWRLGDVHVCALEVVSDVSLRLALSSDMQNADHRVTGTLVVRVLEVDHDHVTLGLELFGASHSVDGHSEPRVAERLSIPFLATLDASGRQVAFEFSESLSQQEASQLEEVVRCFQVVVPEQAPIATSWTAVEQHGTGIYTARYERGEGTGDIRKRKIGYRSPSSNPPSGARALAHSKVEVLDSQMRIFLGSTGVWPCEIDSTEELELTSTEGMLVRVRTRATLHPIAPSSRVAALLFDPTLTVNAIRDLRGLREVADAPDNLLRLVAEDDLERFEMLLQALREGSGTNIAGLNELEALLLLHPDFARRVEELLRFPELDPRSSADLVHALELAGTEACQSVLETVLTGDGFTPGMRLQAVVAMAGLQTPGDRLIESLWNATLQRDFPLQTAIADSAMLAVATLAAKIRDERPATYAWLVARMLEDLQLTGDIGRRSALLDALGNTGDPTVAFEIVPFLSASESRVRAAAARSLGVLGELNELDESVKRPLLVGALQREPVQSVRAALAKSIAEGPGDRATLAAIQDLAANETDRTARFQMTRYLGDNLEIYPEAEPTLRAMLKNDPSDRIRKQIAGVLLQQVRRAEER
jgi:hypothetical protein